MGYYVYVEKGIKIYVEDINPGGEKTILFIHGWPAKHNLFEYQFNLLPKMGYRCIAIDIRGFGKSDKPWHGYSYDILANDVKCVVDALKLQDLILAGHSVGGAIAIRYMSLFNGYKVNKLALFAAAAPSFTKCSNFPYGLNKEEVNKIIKDTYNDRPKMLEEFGNIFFFQHITKPFSQWFFQMGLEAAGYSTIALATSLRDETLFSDIGKIKVPTLILHGIHDKVCPFTLALVQKENIKDSKLIAFEKSGHGLFWEEHEKFNIELDKFIDE